MPNVWRSSDFINYDGTLALSLSNPYNKRIDVRASDQEGHSVAPPSPFVDCEVHQDTTSLYYESFVVTDHVIS